MKTVGHYISGSETLGASGRTAPVFDPGLGLQTKQVALANQEDIESAVAAAHRAFPEWKNTSLAKRQAIIFNFRELLNSRKVELARLITEEHGKVLSDALAEITRGQEVVEFACGMTHLLKGEYSENASTNVDVYSTREALGVVAIVSPFNFPAMVPMWFFPIAIAAGNTVVLKPIEKVPSAAIWIARLWKDAGLPDGVFNVLNGDKEAVDGLLHHQKIAAVSFVGSTDIARYIYQTAAQQGKRVQALGGAKNHMLVLPDADLDLVADSAVNAGFGSAGERCMAISVVVVVEPVADDLVEKIVNRIKRIKVGDGRKACDMGPLVTKSHRDRVASYIDIAKDDGAEVVVDGRDIKPDGDQKGFWLGPTLLDRVPKTSRAYLEEIFGPVLALVRVQSYEEGLMLINGSVFGNGTAIFTSDGGAAKRFQREVEVGMVGINVPVPVPVAYFSFGGSKQSLFGDSRAHGEEGFRFFTQTKVITSRWVNSNRAGLNLGFPEN